MYYGCKVDTFNFRTIGTPPEGIFKYKVPAGIKRDIFSGLTTTLRESVILVEGELDALKARINGIPNVVSYGTNSISLGKVRNAVARGITKFTIIPDNDTKEGVAATMQAGVVNIESSINNLYEGGATEVYIAPLPMVQAEGGKIIKDTEEFIAVFGAKVWYNTVRDNKTAAVAYLIDRSFRQFVERGNFSREDRTALLNKLEEILTAPRYDKYSQREEAYAVVRYYLSIPGNSDYFRFTEEGLRKYVERKRDREAKATREAAYIKDITEAAELAKAGAITLADKKLTDSRSRNYAKNTEAEVGAIFTHPATVEEAEAEIRQLPTGLSTGLYFLTDNGEKQELELKGCENNSCSKYNNDSTSLGFKVLISILTL
jgi:DNA primase